MVIFYATFTLLGIALPYGALIPWLMDHGVDLPLLVSHAMANPISLLAWLDVIIAGIVLLVFIVTESRKHQIKYWPLAVFGTLTVGVSCGLPLFLLLRELATKKSVTN
ncbi:DUF2834 domain-containing protein [Motilimonas eburnea]|uniref:DUF2834 domain-containing protein n=1 Tax=Motilimonas eburnea TaxID=1737488 RepID=UPI001E416E2E|nr:DUF2834 domain-containing protein [Motilimonas eburnea]MCE2571173.1 DUF2834 domain-containing protein [Motilimonas eburnea]